MKIYILALLLNSFLFAGGDFFPVEKLTKYEKMDNTIIDKCIYSCGKPAILLPYNGENIPMAQTYPCPINNCNN